MDLAVVTVSFNTRDLLAECVESVAAALERSGLDGEIWVVDNASADGSADMVRERFPSVHVIAHSENVGFAAGNNLAIRAMCRRPHACPRHVLFLNPDTRVLGDSLGLMVHLLDETPRAAAVGAGLVHADGSFQHSAFRFPGLLQILIDFFPIHPRLVDSRLNGRYPRRLYEQGRAFRVDHPLGAALMVRGAILSQLGGFDERFFMYCEEIDLCRRIWAGGWEVYCLPRAKVVHLVAQSTRQFRDQMYVGLWRSRLLMHEKHNSRAFCWAARRLVRVGLWAERFRALDAHRRAKIDRAQLEGRLRAYQEVADLWR